MKPTPEQEPRLQAHLDQAVKELQTIRGETIARGTNVIWHLFAEVEQELSPEQRCAFRGHETDVCRPEFGRAQREAARGGKALI